MDKDSLLRLLRTVDRSTIKFYINRKNVEVRLANEFEVTIDNIITLRPKTIQEVFVILNSLITKEVANETRIRVWDKTFKEMKYNGFVLFPNGEPHYACRDLYENKIIVNEEIDGIKMLSTGVWDRKKEEIFEKDIIERSKRLYVVEYRHGTFWLIDIIKPSNMIIPLSLCRHEPCEIVGNIFENSELLKGDE